MPRSHTNTLTVSLPHTLTSIHTHTHRQALDESHSMRNEGISAYNKLEEDPLLGAQWKKQM